MPPIEVLSPHVANLIAAGEVVERPASVVKEMVENAVDAGATSVTVEIQNGGMILIRVADNGCGIPAEECETAFLRHATSKLKAAGDLEAIHTLGFRGEALAAIAAVSQLTLFTRPKGQEMGTTLTVDGGEIFNKEEAGCPLGTTFVVRNLFYNTPARLKFVKRDAAEAAAVTAVVQKLALSHPEVAVKYIRDGKQELVTPGDGDLHSALYAVYGRDFALGFTPVKGSLDGIAVEGFASLPVCCRGSRMYQHFFVNGRQVQSKLLTTALEKAYENQKMVGKFPGCVLHLTIKPSAVDVNVHPAKIEVKFLHERQVFDSVYYTVLSALTGRECRPTLVTIPTPREGILHLESTPPPLLRPQPKTAETAIPPSNFDVQKEEKSTVCTPNVEKPVDNVEKPPFSLLPPLHTSVLSPIEKKVSKGRVEDALPSHGQEPPAPPEILPKPPAVSAPPETKPERLPPEPSAPPLLPEKEQDWRLAGEVLRTYLVVEQGETVYFIDKHAAHERMQFDKMKAENWEPMAQSLLAPLMLSPAPEVHAALLEQTALLERFGFLCEDFGGGTLAVREIPSALTAAEAEEALEEIAHTLLSGGRADPHSAFDTVLHTVACKSAIKGGQKNTREELLPIVRAVMEGDVQYCPHGRPVAFPLTKKQLEKQFKRS